MMHKLPSLEKLLKEWEETEVGPTFEYRSFKYKIAEFDNVPPIVPKFLMHLQQSIKPLAQKIQEDSLKLSTEDLKKETLQWIQ